MHSIVLEIAVLKNETGILSLVKESVELRGFSRNSHLQIYFLIILVDGIYYLLCF